MGIVMYNLKSIGTSFAPTELSQANNVYLHLSQIKNSYTSIAQGKYYKENMHYNSIRYLIIIKHIKKITNNKLLYQKP